MVEENKIEEADDEDELKLDDLENRKKDFSGLAKVKEQLSDLYAIVVKGFEDKQDQNEIIDRCWDVYNCELNEYQSYTGVSKVYVPLAHDLIEARVTRFVNNLFPTSQRYSEVISDDGQEEFELKSLLDHYCRTSRLRDNVVPALIRTGDVTGQYSIFMDWSKKERHVLKRVERSTMEQDGVSAEGADEDNFSDVEPETITDQGPDPMVLDARDLCILPASVDKIEDAEVVAVVKRMSKKEIKDGMDAGDYDEEAAQQILDNFTGTDRAGQQPNTAKQNLATAGVKVDGKGSKTALTYLVFSTLKVKGEKRRFVTHFGGENIVLSCKRLPYWNDRVPVLSVPAVKVPGSVWGKSRIANGVEKLQYAANDMTNMAIDSAQYSLLPIVMTDPVKNPKVGSMIMTMAAIWETSPQDTQFVDMPQLWKDALQFVGAMRDQMMTTLGTNPAMLPHGNAGKKPTQAQIAQEQQVALESTADVVTIIENGILDDMLRWFYDMDYQFRDKGIRIKMFGGMGRQELMQEIPPIGVGSHYVFQWYGSEGFRSAQQVQQMIAFTNVLRGIPPEQMGGLKLDLTPLIEYAAGVTFGPRLAPKIIIDQRHMMTMDPNMENELMALNFPTQVHPTDNDQEHLQVHQQGMLETMGTDFEQLFKGHMLEHIKALQAKAAQASGQQPGQQGGPQPPRIGAQPGQNRPVQGPPGQIAPDQMSDPSRMPRRAG